MPGLSWSRRPRAPEVSQRELCKQATGELPRNQLPSWMSAWPFRLSSGHSHLARCPQEQRRDTSSGDERSNNTPVLMAEEQAQQEALRSACLLGFCPGLAYSPCAAYRASPLSKQPSQHPPDLWCKRPSPRSPGPASGCQHAPKLTIPQDNTTGLSRK